MSCASKPLASSAARRLDERHDSGEISRARVTRDSSPDYWGSDDRRQEGDCKMGEGRNRPRQAPAAACRFGRWGLGFGLALLGACGGGGGGGDEEIVPGADLPASAEGAAHFLSQATNGTREEDLLLLQKVGYLAWLENQRTKSITLQRPWVADHAEPSQEQRIERWWISMAEGKDQLRQRVAWALSQIYVISDVDDTLGGYPVGMAEYYDILLRDAFGNWRDLIEHVTLSPQMGEYLSMIKNKKPDYENNIHPDENYARELLQLLSIGLVQLGPDGVPLVDGNGDTLPTYDQGVVQALARAFTGWTYADSEYYEWGETNYAPMEAWEQHHDYEPKQILGGQWLAPGQGAPVDLAGVLDAIFAHLNVGPFLAQQLIQRLVTSNPSPAYVGRVAAVFDDDGTGERGDLWEVVKALLLDEEARHGHETDPYTFGKLREPLLRQIQLWRAFHGDPVGDTYGDSWPQDTFGQRPLGAPSVFNFYSPFHQPPGELAAAGLVAPELQIHTHNRMTALTNKLYQRIFASYSGYPWANHDTVYLKLSKEKALAADPSALVQRLDLLLLSGQMSAELESIVTAYVADVPLDDDGTERVIEALYLIATSPEGALQR
jgi:uncharacterized protein (DUF1800 family)